MILFRLITRALLLLTVLSATSLAQRPASPVGSAAEQFAIARGFEEAGAYQAALNNYRAVVRYYPYSPEASKAQFKVAEILQASGNLTRAFDAYQDLLKKYPNSPDFERAVAAQIEIANSMLEGRRINFLGITFTPGKERTQKMYEEILANAPYSKQAPIVQFNLGVAYERQNKFKEAIQAYQAVIDRYPDSDVADDALYQIGYVNYRIGSSGRSQDLSALITAKETFEDFLIEHPNSEKAAQAKETLALIGAREAGDLLAIARFYERQRDFRAAAIYYNDIIRRQPNTEDAKIAAARVQEMRNQYGDDALRIGPERTDTGERAAIRRRLQAEVETTAMSDYAGPPRREIVPDELPAPKPELRTGIRDTVQPLPPVEPELPTE